MREPIQRPKHGVRWISPALLSVALLAAACASPQRQRDRADRDVDRILRQQQQELFDRDETLAIERPADTLRRQLLLEQGLPHAGTNGPVSAEADAEQVFAIDLVTALGVGARQSRDYQDRKEDIFRAALNLDTEAFAFDPALAGTASSTYTENRAGEETQRGILQSAALGASRTLRTGAALSSRIMFDLVRLLSLDRDTAYGIMADLSVTVPLLRGAGRAIVTEPLTQAERNVMYAMLAFEEFKGTYAVRVATQYLQVLQQQDQVQNARDNLERVDVSADRAFRLAEAGRLPEIQVDQAQQEALRARDRWLAAQSAYERSLDQLKVTLGLPADARVALDGADLTGLIDAVADDNEGMDEPVRVGIEAQWTEDEATRLALAQRRDLLVAQRRVEDAERGIQVAADRLRWQANLVASGQMGSRRGLGSAGLSNARLDPDEGVYGLGLEVEAPWSRRAARNAYRDSFIARDRAIRAVEELEDRIKVEIREALRVLVQARESMAIQARSVELAQRRVDSTELFLQAGRAQIRDVLEAQEALVSARNAFTAAVVTYRLAALQLQRDMGVLAVDEDGQWTEFAGIDPMEVEGD